MTNILRWAGAVLLACAVPGATARAQDRCTLPSAIAAPRIIAADTVVRRAPDYYALALSWSPAYCAKPVCDDGAAACKRIHGRRGYRTSDASGFQCEDNSFALVVHGLWGQNARSRGAKGQPRHCDASPVSADTLAKTLCTVPGVKLIQDEWQKHGTCTGMTEQDYFARTRALWGELVKPDLAALAGADGTTTAGAIAAALVKANRRSGLFAEAVAIPPQPENEFSEVLVCYDLAFHFTACAVNTLDDGQRLRVTPPRKKTSAG